MRRVKDSWILVDLPCVDLWSLIMRTALGVDVIVDVPAESFCPFLVLAGEIGMNGHELVVPEVINVSPGDAARNKIFKVAIDYDCDLVMFVSQDTVIPPGGYMKLFNALKSSNAVMATGHYYQRAPQYLPVWFKIVDDKCYRVQAPIDHPPVEIYGCGSGAALMDLRWIVEHFDPPYYVPVFRNDGSPLDPDAKGFRAGESDTLFCERINKSGGKIIGVPSVRCTHLGRRTSVNDDTVVDLRRAAGLKLPESWPGDKDSQPQSQLE